MFVTALPILPFLASVPLARAREVCLKLCRLRERFASAIFLTSVESMVELLGRQLMRFRRTAKRNRHYPTTCWKCASMGRTSSGIRGGQMERLRVTLVYGFKYLKVMLTSRLPPCVSAYLGVGRRVITWVIQSKTPRNVLRAACTCYDADQRCPLLSRRT